jgi:SAM-dependent methyltransferase
MTRSATTAFEQEYYEANYRDYDRQNPRRKLEHYARAVERFQSGGKARSVLDIGCAFGAFLGSLGAHWQVAGLDHSAYAIDIARQRVPHGRFAVVRDSHIPFEERFQAITAFDVIEHIHDLEALAGEIAAHLADDGVFVFVVPVYDGPLGPLVHALDHDPTHAHKRARRFWLDWANRHFSVIEWWGIVRYLLPAGPYIHWPTRSLRAVAPAIAVAARQRPLPDRDA